MFSTGNQIKCGVKDKIVRIIAEKVGKTHLFCNKKPRFCSRNGTSRSSSY